MKKLSIEQKARRYDEAIKEAVIAHKDEDKHLKATLERIFPELVESDDERVRKWLIGYFKHNEVAKIIKTDDIIAWLEKQGDTHEVEPKFYEGEWITNGDYTWRIIEVNPLDYILQLQDGYTVDDTISHVDEHFHLWTIEDAKDGDVLSFNDGHGNDCIELIKSITGKKIEFWFCLTNGNRYEVFDGITPYTNLISREDATPATKEQRDLLFQIMKEAGYEWDAEKKELEELVIKLKEK